jgi:hypothetical protein
MMPTSAEGDKRRQSKSPRRQAGEPAGHEPRDGGRRDAMRRSVGIDERKSGDDTVHRQRHDEWKNTERDNANAVDEARRGAEQQHCWNRPDGARVRTVGP